MEKISIVNPFNGAPVYYVKETVSTMILAREAAGIDGTVVMTGYQTGGRGRIEGRTWQAEPDKNLLLTLVLGKGEADRSMLPVPLAAGLGVSLFLEESFGLEPEIKWPNDLLVNGKKISGIIAESSGGNTFVGIGINVNQTSFSEDFKVPATSVRLETGEDADLKASVEPLLECLQKALGCNNQKEEIERRMYGMGKMITFLSGDPLKGRLIKAVNSGLGKDGAIILKTESGEIINAGAGEIILL